MNSVPSYSVLLLIDPTTEAAKKMAPLKTRVGKPILVDDDEKLPSARLSTGYETARTFDLVQKLTFTALLR